MPDKPKKPEFIDDESTVNKPPPAGLDEDDDEERTSIALDLTPKEPEKKPAGLGDEDEEEATKVLDWDRAMRKSLEDKKPKK